MSENQVTAQNGEAPPMSDEEVLAFTRGVRLRVVNQLIGNGQVSTDNSDRILLTNMLKDLDSQAINSKKIAVDQKNNDRTAVIVAELLKTIDKGNIFTIDDPNAVREVKERVLPTTIDDVTALPGEMDVNPPQLDYASFVKSQGKDIDQIGVSTMHPEAENDTD